MKKWPLWKKIIIIAAAVIVLITGIGLTALYYIGDRIVEEAIESELGDIDSQLEEAVENTAPSSTGDLTEGTSTGVSQTESGTTAVSTVAGTESSKNQSDNKTTATKTSSSTGGTSKNTTVTEKTTQPEKMPAQKPQITATEIKEIKDQVSPVDKMEAAALVMKRLSDNDIDTLTAMLSGGLTPEEKEQAKKIAYSRFNGEEIAKIKEMYSKYMQEAQASPN